MACIKIFNCYANVSFLSIFHAKDEISFQSQMIFYLLHIRQMCQSTPDDPHQQICYKKFGMCFANNLIAHYDNGIEILIAFRISVNNS